MLLSCHLLGKSYSLGFLCIFDYLYFSYFPFKFREQNSGSDCMLVTFSRLMTSVGEFSAIVYS